MSLAFAGDKIEVENFNPTLRLGPVIVLAVGFAIVDLWDTKSVDGDETAHG